MLSKQASKFEEIAYLSTQYAELERHIAWQDFNYRIKAVREAIQEEILRGSLDKYGKDRTDEKRAALHFVSLIQGIAPAIRRDFDQIQAKLKDRVEAREQSLGRKIEEHITNWSTVSKTVAKNV